MKILSKKSYGFYVVMIAALAALISVVRYASWASAHNTLNAMIVAALIAGIILDLVTIVKDEDLLIVLATACYAFALFRHFTDQVGSFVDKFQGINLFGDATQVGTIISIGVVMAVSAVLSVAAGFMKREKEA
jgi:prepilin signal peptidase PulO-like enzyme (type II secretory pathway)